MITVKTVDNPIDAHLIKTKLESAGVLCQLFNENIVTHNPLLPVAVCSIKVNVAAKDYEHAATLVEEMDSAASYDEPDELVVCPNCDCTSIDNKFYSQNDIRSLLASLFSLATMSYPIYVSKRYRCKKCDTVFDLPQ